MANIKISDLAPVTLPLDPDFSFFEVQTIEAGVNVSRKITADEMGIGGAVISVNSGVNITVDNTDPLNPIVNLNASIIGMTVNGVVLSSIGGATSYLDETGNYSVPVGSGQVDSVVGGLNISVDATDPVNPIVNLPAAISGMTVNSVILDAGGVATNYLDETGNYSAPAGGGQVDSVSGGTNINVTGTAVDPIVNLDASISGMTINGVVLTTGGVATNYLDETGAYSVPPSGAPSDPLILGSINLTSALSTSTLGAPYINVPINIGANLTGTQGMTQLSRQRIQTKPSAFSFNSTLFVNVDGAGTSGSDTIIGGLNSANIEIEFGVAVRLQHGLSGLHVLETDATGIYLEQGSCYIEQKAAQGAVTAQRGEFWVISSAPNRPMFTDDTGVDFDLTTGAFDTAANYVMSGSWEFTNVLGIEFGPSCELRLRNSGDSSTTFIQNIGPTLQFGIAGADFGSGVFEIAQTSFVRLESPSIFIREQAAGADILQEGQLWVRADSFSNTLMYRNDVGSDFEIGGIPYNGDLLDGSFLMATTTYTGVVNIAPKPNTFYTLIITGQMTTPNAADDGKLEITCDTNSVLTGLYTDSMGASEGIRSALGEVITNTIVVDTDGSGVDDGTFFTIVCMLKTGATGQTVSLRVAKNADAGGDGLCTFPTMSVVPLVEA
jgi:hypothetical protein